MTKTKNSLIAAMLTATAMATATLFTCEKVPDFCGTGALYDPSCQFCFGNEAYNMCGGKDYNPLTQGCDRNRNTVGTRCLDESVVPSGTPCGGYTLTIAATPEIGGRAVNNTPPKGPTYGVGEQVIISAIPNDQYKFAGWAGAQLTGGEVASYTMKGNTPQVSIVAMFKHIGKGKLATEAFPKEGGTITLSPNKDTYSDEPVTVTAANKPGYTFIGWSGDDTSKNATITVFMDESKTLVAMFKPVAHTLSVNANPSDAGAVFVNGTALAGALSQNFGSRGVSVWAIAEKGYTFKNWSGTAAKFENANNQNTTVTLEANATITANFTRGDGGKVTTPSMICTLTVNKNPEIGGSVSLNPDGRVYNMGILVTATAKPAGEYRFTGWSDGSKNISNDTMTTITMDKNKTLIAKFQLKPKAGQFIITVDPNNGAQTSEVITDTNGVLAVLPSAPARSGYTFDGWYTTLSTGGERVSAGYKFTSNDVIYARWTAAGWNINNCVSAGLCKTARMPDGKMWMAENLNIDIGTANSWCYNNADSNCVKYGRLYTWNAAKTACPTGWRLPDTSDWNRLVATAGGSIAGSKLKSSSGWNNYSGISGNDQYGFSALPGGQRASDGSFGNFIDAGDYGYWWTATEYGSNAYTRGIYYDNDNVGEGYGGKSNGFSVRCLEGESTIPTPTTYAVIVSSAGTSATGGGSYAVGATVSISAGTAPNGQQFKNWTSANGVTFANANSATTTFTMPSKAVTVTAYFVNSNIKLGAFKDVRDGKTYSTVEIDSKTWMAENLNYNIVNGIGSWCYGEGGQAYVDGKLTTLTLSQIQANCDKYGRLYTWAAAKMACPSGWHLSSRGEWDSLVITAGAWSTAGSILRSTSGWDEFNGISSTDDFGFSALPGGIYSVYEIDGRWFEGNNYSGYWWTATEYGENNAYNIYMVNFSNNVGEGSGEKRHAFSVRCVEDK